MKSNLIAALLIANTSAIKVQEIDGLYPTQVWVPGPKLTPWDPDQQAAEKSQKEGFEFRSKRTVVDQIDLQTGAQVSNDPNAPTRDWVVGPRDTGSNDPDHMAAVARQRDQHQRFSVPSIHTAGLMQADPNSPTREWIDGPGYPNDPEQQAAEQRYKEQFERFAVPSVHPRYNKNGQTLMQADPNSPTREWVDGPGFPNDPEQRAAEERYKEQFEKFAVPSIHPRYNKN